MQVETEHVKASSTVKSSVQGKEPRGSLLKHLDIFAYWKTGAERGKSVLLNGEWGASPGGLKVEFNFT